MSAIGTEVDALVTALRGDSNFSGYTVQNGYAEVSAPAISVVVEGGETEGYVTGSNNYLIVWRIDVNLSVQSDNATAPVSTWVTKFNQMVARTKATNTTWDMVSISDIDVTPEDVAQVHGTATFRRIEQTNFTV